MSATRMQLLSNELWAKLRNLAQSERPISAAIAYYSKDHLLLSEGDVLICDASDNCIEAGATSGRLLKKLHASGVKVFHREGLHAKAASIGRFVIVGSANSSSNSEKALTEAAVLSQDIALRAQVMAFIETVRRDSVELDELELSRLAEIKVKRRPPTPRSKPVKVDLGGDQAWWLATRPLSAKLQNKEETEEREGIQEARRLLNDPEADIESIRWTLKSTVAKDAQPGHIVIQVYTTGSGPGAKTKVFAPAAIVHRKVVDNHMRIFVQSVRDDAKPLPLKRVLTALSRVSGPAPGITSARKISREQLDAVDGLFK